MAPSATTDFKHEDIVTKSGLSLPENAAKRLAKAVGDIRNRLEKPPAASHD